MDERRGPLVGAGSARTAQETPLTIPAHPRAPFSSSLVLLVLLSMLLMLGVACATVSAAPVPPTAVSASGPDPTAHFGAADDPSEVVSGASGKAATSPGEGLGAVVCAVGVLCGALLLVVTARWRRPSSTKDIVWRFATIAPVLPRIGVRVTASTLLQLRVSRT